MGGMRYASTIQSTTPAPMRQDLSDKFHSSAPFFEQCKYNILYLNNTKIIRLSCIPTPGDLDNFQVEHGDHHSQENYASKTSETSTTSLIGCLLTYLP
jgi:hypothetical protein